MKTGIILKELETLLEKVSREQLEALAGRIVFAPRVFVSGAGRSGLALKMFAMRLGQMGKTAFVAGETMTPAIGKGDLLLVASASGKTESVCRHAKIAREAGADVFLITANRDVLLENERLVLDCPSKAEGKDGSIQPMGSLFEQAVLILLDACILSCMEAMGETAESMRARHANLE